jgi:hypothetical protein
MTGVYLVSTKHPVTLFSWRVGKQIDIEGKIAAWYLCDKSGEEFESCRARHFGTETDVGGDMHLIHAWAKPFGNVGAKFPCRILNIRNTGRRRVLA